MITRDEELKWAYLLDPCFELTNSAGKPLTDGYIEVYIAGTRNKYYCASDFAGTLHPFQIPLDSLGSNIVLANPDNAYDVYVYNRYGNLIMSRYNVTPADGGAVISNTERINELEDTLVSAVTGLQGQIDDINETLENKKDKQEPYSVTLTPTQTVSAIIQNENGEMEVIYQEIDLPEEVPNVDIVSPASTISITTHIDEETNTKTFSIDLSDLGHLEYGQYMATEDVITGANMYRIKGNLDTTLDGKIKLHKGNSYHITVRGAYVCTDITNSLNTLDYIEYSTFTPFHVDVDNTVTDPQNFEISYDIFKLSNDTNYYIAFAASAGKVSNLTVEIHSLSNLSILDPDFKYQEGWGINIVSSVISVDPDIFNDYTTHTDVYESIVTAIDFVTGAMPATQVQSDWDETDESSPAYIQNKPDLDIYATHDEVNTVSGEIIETVNNVSSVLHEEITNNNDTVIETINNVSGILHEEIIETAQVITGLIPDVSDFTTHEDVNSAIVTAIEYITGIIPDAQVQSDWDQSDDTQPDYIKNKPDLDIYATHDEVNTVSGQIVEIVNNVSGDIIETVNNVSGEIIEIVNNVSGILHGEIENIPEQQQADWDQNDDTQVDYIKNKPDLSIYATHDEVTAAVSSIDLSEYATHTEVYDSSVTAIQLVTGLIPDVSDFTTHDEVHESIVSALEYVTGIIPDAQVQSDWTETDTTDPAYIKHKPNQTELVAGQNIGIFDNGSTLTIAASGTDLTGYATETEVHESSVTAIQLVTGLIPTDYATIEDVVEIVSGVTGIGDYGQFYAPSPVYTHAVMARTKGNIETTQYGDIKLKKGNSYHITVRGRYNQTTPTNVYGNISYVEYITGGNININVDKSITESQYFEVSYDLYKLNSDTDYQISFSGISNAAVNDLYIEIHALGGIGGNGGSVTGAAEYDAGWGIQILNNVISVNPSILNDYVTENELVTAIQTVVTAIPELPDDINLVAGTNIGIMVSGNDLVIAASGSDLSDYATLEQLQDSVELVTGLIPDTSDLATKAELQDGLELVTGLIPDVSNLATKGELQDGLELVTGLIPTIQLNESNLVTSINNYPIYSEGGAGTTYTAGDGIDITNNIISVDNTVALKTDIPDVSDLATKAELQDGLELVTGLIPDVTNYATHAEVNNVSGAIVDLIPELPEDLNLVAGQNIGIAISGNDIVISASGSDMSDYVTEEELIEAVTAVTAAIPAAQVQSNWNESDVSSPAYIQNKPTIPSIEGLATVAQVSAVSGYLQSEIDNIPAQVQSDWTEDDNTDPAYIQNKPDQVRLVAGQNITIVDDVDIVTISASVPSVTGFATKEELQDGLELVTGLIPSIDGLATVESVTSVSATLQTEIDNIPSGIIYAGASGIVVDNDTITLDDPLEILPGANISFVEGENSITIAATVPVVTGFATKEELQDGLELVTGMIPEQVSGASGIIVEDNIVALDEPLEILAGQNITFTEGDNSITISANIPPVTGFATVAEVQVVSGYLQNEIDNIPSGTEYTAGNGIDITNDVISIDNTVALKTDIPVVTGFATIEQVSAVSAAIPELPDEEEVDFEEIDLSDYALASAIPTLNSLNTAGITDIQLVNELPVLPVATVLYLIPEV